MTTILLATLVMASNATAATINATGNWSFTANGQGFTDQLFTGSTTFSYDDGAVPALGVFDIFNIPLTTFSQTPSPLGTTIFDTTNVGAQIRFSDGMLIITNVGGLINTITGLGDNTDDFQVQLNSVPSSEALLTVGSFSGFATLTDVTVDFVHTPAAVPVPAAVWLFGSGLMGLLGLARRNHGV